MIIAFLKDILAPKKCYGCKKQGHFLCPICENKIPKQLSACYYCKQKSDIFTTHRQCREYIDLDQVILYTRYSNQLVSKLIKHGKFYNKKDIWEEMSQHYIHVLLENISGNLNNYILVPVPMYFWKKAFRGYNQSELLVRHISKQTGISAEYNLIKKIKKTQQQSHLSKSQRQGNLDASMVVNKKLIDKHKNKTIILIDDVISTGATLNSISKLLKKSSVHHMIGCAFASD